MRTIEINFCKRTKSKVKLIVTLEGGHRFQTICKGTEDAQKLLRSMFGINLWNKTYLQNYQRSQIFPVCEAEVKLVESELPRRTVVFARSPKGGSASVVGF